MASGEDQLAADKPISIAIFATGGQGGGVLSDWIVQLAETQGWAAQATSVPGVAQRTGATIYYIELLMPRRKTQPVFSLMPTPGDVDVVLAAELMEAGRAILRGFVSPSRTTLIASSHRSLAVVEKIVPGDGIRSPQAVIDAAEVAAKRIISIDMNLMAERSKSVISAALFGALASAEVLPFARSAFENTIRAAGKGVEPSLRAFSTVYDRVQQFPREPIARGPNKLMPPLPERAPHPRLEPLLIRIRRGFPAMCHSMLFAGIRRLVDYQDIAYADEYLDRMEKLYILDAASGGSHHNFALTVEAAKRLAVAMTYDDVIRVADLKTRANRFGRIRREIGIHARQIIYTTEYMQPRLAEILGTLPGGVERVLDKWPRLRGAIARRIDRGRRIRSNTVVGFFVLYVIGRAKFLRRRSLRHRRECVHLERWLGTATRYIADSYELATEIIASHRIVKGYSDTHARGLAKFDKILTVVPTLAGTKYPAESLKRLTQAALLEESGESLDIAIKDIEQACAAL